jgi:hypothetical protein
MDRAASRVAVLCAVVLFVPCLAAHAQIPQKMNYQVMLTDDADQPLVDQPIQMVFGLYAASSGGSPLWTETQDVTTNSIGVVSVILGAVNPIDIDLDAPLWLEIEVEGETLSPRRELVMSPYAGRAAMASNSERLGNVDASEYVLFDDLDGPGTVNAPGNPVDWNMLFGVPAGFADGADDTGGVGDGHSLDADDGSPVDALYVDSDGEVGIGTVTPEATLAVDGDVEVGTFNESASLRVGGSHVNNAAVGLESLTNRGGVITLREESGTLQANLGTESAGGAYLVLYRDDGGSEGFNLDANGSATGEPLMEITGSSRSAVFDMDEEGDSSVQLPDEAVSSAEMWDEPGVASIQAEPYIYLSAGQVISVAARTINVPADGFVFVMGTAQVNFDNNPSQRHHAMFGISESQTAWSGAAQEAEIEVPDGGPTGAMYNQHIAVSGLFAVSAGSSTFYLLAYEDVGACAVRARQLSLMYFPTQYGTVDTTD